MHRRLSHLALVALAAVAPSMLMLAGLLAPNAAQAQAPAGATVPPAEAFDIRYYVTTAEGKRARAMDSIDFTRFFNKARCQCGHKIEAQIRLKATQGMTYDNTKQLQSFVGTMCNTAEANPAGQFRRCIRINASTAPVYVQGLNTTFHPVWLASGIAIASGETRDPDNAIAASNCEAGSQGQSGVWLCADTNGSPNCQSDEFFITGTQNANLPAGMSGGIQFDYLAPLTVPTNVQAQPGDSAVIVSWDVLPGDINGFRVLCEEVDTGKPPPNKGLTPPALTAKQNGTVYFTRDNMCPGEPFSTFKGGNNDPIVGGTTTASTTDDSVGATTDDTASDTTGTDTSDTGGSDTGGSDTSVSLTCGDGMVDDGEECDDGEDNGDDKACHSDCLSDVCGDAKKGPDEACDNGDANGDGKLCSSTCTLGGSAGLIGLDYSYVCTGHLSYNTKSVRIEGLENDKKYNFLLVAYDAAGNPLAHDTLITATPVDTRDLWEQCKADGDVCGDSGFCNVAGDRRGDDLLALGAVLGLGLGLRGLIRRSRRKRA